MDCFVQLSLPRVKQSACGCSLDTGAVTIAWFQIIGGIIIVFGSTTSLIMENADASQENQPETGIIATYIVFGLCQLVLGLVLILSAKWKLLDYVNVWVVISIVITGIYVGVLVGQTVLLLADGLFDVGATILIFGTLAIGLSFYCIIVVSSFRKEVKAADGRL